MDWREDCVSATPGTGEIVKSSIITTDKAKCRDCYRCVRVCPVKAICISDGQARVDAERCIVCGTCVRECPQQAKHVRNDLESLAALLLPRA